MSRNRYGNNRNRSNAKKERMIMIATSVFVLTAMTLTGIYVKENNKADKDNGYTIDFSELDPPETHKTDDNDNTDRQESSINAGTNAADNYDTARIDNSMEDDLDYAPWLHSVESTNVENPILTADASEDEGELSVQAEGTEQEELEESVETAGESVQTVTQPELHFHEDDRLSWPITGNILINYSMDKTVFFPTLQQYKYNPAIVIEAAEGENITAAADGKVTDIFYSEEIGNGITMEIGNGYELTYGQLDNIQVSEGAYVEAGDIVGSVAAPTKYYSVEGCNVYFKLEKDGTAVNPMTLLN